MTDLHTCDSCKHLKFEGATSDSPYPDVWCEAKSWDSVEHINALSEKHDCDAWEATQDN